MFKSIRIENFKGVKDYSYTPDSKVTAFVGGNGKGKTSIKEAIYAAFTGIFPNNPISEDADFTRISVILDDGVSFSRAYNRYKGSEVRLNGRVTTAKSLNTFLEDCLGVSKTEMTYSSSEDVVSSLKSSELGSFLLSRIPEKLDVDTVLKHCSKIDQKTVDFLKENLPEMPTKFDLGLIKELEEKVANNLKKIRKEIAFLKSKKTALGIAIPKQTRKEVEKEIEELTAEISNQASIKKAHDLWASIVNDANTQRATLLNVKERFEKIDATEPDSKQLEAIEKELLSAKTRLEDLNVQVTTIKMNINLFKKTLENLNKPVCPINDKLICSTDKSVVKQEITEANESNLSLLKKLSKEVAELEECVKKGEKEREAYGKNTEAWGKKQIYKEQYNSIKKAIPTIPAEPPKPSSVEALTKRLKDAKEELKIIESFEELRATKSKLFDLMAEEKILKDANSSLKDKGPIITGILKDYALIFESVVNSRCEALGIDFEFKFIPKDGMQYLVKTTSDFTPYENLSSGEKTITHFMIMDLINSLTGFKFIEIDNLDNLDSEAVHALLELITSEDVLSNYEHIILCSVDHTDIIHSLSLFSIDIISR